MKTFKTLILASLLLVITIGQSQTRAILEKGKQSNDIVIEKSKYDDKVHLEKSIKSTYYFYMDTMFLPDGNGDTYSTSITVDQFALGQTLSNVDQLLGVCANMEHSFLGDLVISLTCPNGSNVILEAQGGSGTFLGIPIDDFTDDPGIGYDYCWSQNPTYGTMISEADAGIYSTLPTGSYAPSGSFTNLLGCPLNGDWSINVTDNWELDNGYIFGWSLGFDLDLVNLTKITGNIYADMDEDCNFNGSDWPMSNVWLEFNPGPYYAVTDQNGYYSVYVDIGTYTVNQTNLNPLFAQNCPSTGGYTIDVTQVGDTLEGYDFANTASVYCPNLSVDVATWGIRPCMESNYTVVYTNNGTYPASNAVIDIEIDPHMTYVSSTGTLISQNGNILSFDIGTVNPAVTGSFHILVDIECDTNLIGSTMCLEAHIFPDTACFEPNPAWDHSSVAVEGECRDSLVCFDISNTGDAGDGDMLTESEYRIYDDNLLVFTGTFQIQGEQSIEICWPANGNTIRLEADQHPMHPGSSHPQDAIEMCGDTVGGYTTGIINSTQQDDLDNFVEIYCMEVTGSFDPNDKSGMPTGITEEYHYIDTSDMIEYFIRFQNTGTDTAFNVFIIDTISQYLDVTSIEPGVSSHPYTIEVLNSDVIRFVFNNILLPDSGANQTESNGFVKFKINQISGTQPGDYIENTAAIIFDFNVPVITNTVFNTIEHLENVTNVQPISYTEEVSISVYPNPFSSETTFKIGDINQQYNFSLYDIMGKEVLSSKNLTGEEYTLQRNNLTNGIYIYKFTTANGLLCSGKIIVN